VPVGIHHRHRLTATCHTPFVWLAGGLTDDGLALVERLVITLLRKADADLRSGPALVWQEIRTPAQLYGMRASRAVAYTELQVIKRIMRARQQARQQALAGH
jgi:hypothetical protein